MCLAISYQELFTHNTQWWNLCSLYFSLTLYGGQQLTYSGRFTALQGMTASEYYHAQLSQATEDFYRGRID